MPAAYHDHQNNMVRLGSDSTAFVVLDLDVSRLNRMHRYLWLAGRSTSARSLHRQRMMERQIVITEQADLHLTWHESRIFLKPLPDYLFDDRLWETIICQNATLHANSCGFLLSYVWLLCHPSDLRIAVETGLVSSQITWENWTKFVDAFFSNVDCAALDTVNQRYQYGELRLARLNIIYRLTHISRPDQFMRGYMYNYNRYTVFFDRHFGWILVVFLYITIILTAMQVGLGTSDLQQDSLFQRACSGFAVFSIVLSICVATVGLVLFLWFFLINFLTTRTYWRRQRQHRQELLRSKAAEVP